MLTGGGSGNGTVKMKQCRENLKFFTLLKVFIVCPHIEVNSVHAIVPLLIKQPLLGKVGKKRHSFKLLLT